MYDGKLNWKKGGAKQETNGVEDKDKAETGHKCFGFMVEENISATPRSVNRYKECRKKYSPVKHKNSPKTTPCLTGISATPAWL